MNTDYNPKLYAQIENLPLNKIIVVDKKKGSPEVIHIQKITDLTWHQLQILVPDGANRPSKMVLLYEALTTGCASTVKIKGEELSAPETDEIIKYLAIYRSNGFRKHHETNDFISNNNMWDVFPTIRSLNDHGEYTDIEGIQPKYFHIICQLLDISGEGGRTLDRFKRY